MASYFTSYYDVGSKKVGERVVTNDEQIVYLFHVFQESREKLVGPLEQIVISFISHLHVS